MSDGDDTGDAILVLMVEKYLDNYMLDVRRRSGSVIAFSMAANNKKW